MALPSADLIQDSFENLWDAIINDKTLTGSRRAVQRLNELQGYINTLYAIIDIAITDDDDAGVSEFVAAEATISVGTVFRITSTTEDLLDDAFGSAKNARGQGSVVALNDLYVISGADAVVFLGNNSNSDGRSIPFDMSGELISDFLDITNP